MYNTTLRGVFPEPKPTHKRNFVKENVTRIKQLQGIVPNSEDLSKKLPVRKATVKRSLKSMSHPSKHFLQTRSNSFPKTQKGNTKRKTEKPPKLDLSVPDTVIRNDKISHRAVQTDRPEEICSLYANGTIIYPSAKVIKQTKNDKCVKKPQSHGDVDGIVVTNPHQDELCDEMQCLDIEEKHNFIKENIMALKSRTKCVSPTDTVKGHQKGVLPKYLKERKEEQKRQNEVDPECPPGHVLLPDDERRETLRVLRQSYADRIKELNNMPVSNDTLKRRQRKMAIEEELKKIEEGIKVFQRPKVYVKINA